MNNRPFCDIEIVKGCKNEDRRFQKMLYEQNYENLLGLALRYYSDTSTANSMVNESFLKIFMKIGTYNEKGSLIGWMRTIVRNTILDSIRRNQKLVYTDEIGSVSMDLVDENEVLNQINEEEVLRVLSKLKEDERVVFNLFVLEGFTHKDIAKMLNLKEGRSRVLLHQSKSRLRKLLGNRKLTNVLIG